MSQASTVIANGSGSAFRIALNAALAALNSSNSGASAPSTTYPYMLWFDMTNNVLLMRNAANTGWRGILPPGIGPTPFAGTVAPQGYLLFGSDYSRSAYAGLFAVVGTKFGAGDGSTTFGLHMEGLTVVSAGTGTISASGVNADVDTTADDFTVATNTAKWITGMSVVFTLSSGTITGLTSGNTYYVIREGATKVQLASSLANAQNNNSIDLTAKSSPVWTITHTRVARTLGDVGGEDMHAMCLAELLAHTHPLSSSATGSAGQSGGSTASSVTGSRGGNNAMNIMQPHIVTNHIITF